MVQHRDAVRNAARQRRAAAAPAALDCALGLGLQFQTMAEALREEHVAGDVPCGWAPGSSPQLSSPSQCRCSHEGPRSPFFVGDQAPNATGRQEVNQGTDLALPPRLSLSSFTTPALQRRTFPFFFRNPFCD
ncbi:hypothetical protein HPB50_028856 [Hyalomma asiaticum]|nr:hypothetical protein HPB50_028856 [Hyalomma asiaticum]